MPSSKRRWRSRMFPSRTNGAGSRGVFCVSSVNCSAARSSLPSMRQRLPHQVARHPDHRALGHQPDERLGLDHGIGGAPTRQHLGGQAEMRLRVVRRRQLRTGPRPARAGPRAPARRPAGTARARAAVASTMVSAIVMREAYSMLRREVRAPSSTHASAITAPAMRQRARRSTDVPRTISHRTASTSEHRQSRHRQVHPALGAHFGGNRHEAGGRRQRDEDPGAQKPQHRPAPQRHQRQDARAPPPPRRGG